MKYIRKFGFPNFPHNFSNFMTALANLSFQEWRSKTDLWGRLVEVALGNLANEAIRQGIEMYYWRKGNYQVDFVMCKGKKIVALARSQKRKKTCFSFRIKTVHETV